MAHDSVVVVVVALSVETRLAVATTAVAVVMVDAAGSFDDVVEVTVAAVGIVVAEVVVGAGKMTGAAEEEVVPLLLTGVLSSCDVMCVTMLCQQISAQLVNNTRNSAGKL